MTATFYHYRAFGLNVASAIPLSGLLPTPGTADVAITVAELPVQLVGATNEAPFRRVAPGEYICRNQFFGGYAIYHGQKIILTPQTVLFLETSEQAALLLESIFIFLWLQRGALCLHASSVNINGRAVVFTGDGGSGKSTTSAALACQGHDKLADDMCLITMTPQGAPHVVPLCRSQNLTTDALDLLGLPSIGACKMPGEEKYVLPYVSITSSPVPLIGIFHLYPADTDEMKLLSVTGFEKLAILAANSKNGEEAVQMVPGSGSLMERQVELGGSVAMIRIIRPLGRRCLTELAATIEEITTKGGEIHEKKRMASSAA